MKENFDSIKSFRIEVKNVGPHLLLGAVVIGFLLSLVGSKKKYLGRVDILCVKEI